MAREASRIRLRRKVTFENLPQTTKQHWSDMKKTLVVTKGCRFKDIVPIRGGGHP